MDEDIRRTIGGNVRAEMARAGLSQDQVAELLGISQPQVSKRLLGAIPFDAVELTKLAIELRISPSAFFVRSAEAVAQ